MCKKGVFPLQESKGYKIYVKLQNHTITIFPQLFIKLIIGFQSDTSVKHGIFGSSGETCWVPEDNVSQGWVVLGDCESVEEGGPRVAVG